MRNPDQAGFAGWQELQGRSWPWPGQESDHTNAQIHPIPVQPRRTFMTTMATALRCRRQMAMTEGAKQKSQKPIIAKAAVNGDPEDHAHEWVHSFIICPTPL